MLEHSVPDPHYGRRESPSTSTATMNVSHSARVKRTDPALGWLELRTSTTSSTRRASTHCPLVPLRVGFCHRSLSAAISAHSFWSGHAVLRPLDHSDRLK